MMTLNEQQLAQFARDGFLNGGTILSEAEVQELTAALDRILEKGPAGFGPDERRPVLFRDLSRAGKDSGYQTAGTRTVWQIVNIWEASPVFERLLYHPCIVDAISRMTGFRDLQVWHDQIQYKPAGHGGATGWHQDAPAWPSIEPMTPVSAWLPMDDADLDNGCMWMVPGSHQWGNRSEHLATQGGLKTLAEFPTVQPADPSHQIRAVPCPVKRGEVHFHHSLTWHGSPENHSSRPRRAIAIHYMSSDARFTGRDHPMRQFIQVKPGESMRHAGPHFPIVCRQGVPVSPPE